MHSVERADACKSEPEGHASQPDRAPGLAPAERIGLVLWPLLRRLALIGAKSGRAADVNMEAQTEMLRVLPRKNDPQTPSKDPQGRPLATRTPRTDRKSVMVGMIYLDMLAYMAPDAPIHIPESATPTWRCGCGRKMKNVCYVLSRSSDSYAARAMCMRCAPISLPMTVGKRCHACRAECTAFSGLCGECSRTFFSEVDPPFLTLRPNIASILGLAGLQAGQGYEMDPIGVARLAGMVRGERRLGEIPLYYSHGVNSAKAPAEHGSTRVLQRQWREITEEMAMVIEKLVVPVSSAGPVVVGRTCLAGEQISLGEPATSPGPAEASIEVTPPAERIIACTVCSSEGASSWPVCQECTTLLSSLFVSLVLCSSEGGDQDHRALFRCNSPTSEVGFWIDAPRLVFGSFTAEDLKHALSMMKSCGSAYASKEKRRKKMDGLPRTRPGSDGWLGASVSSSTPLESYPSPSLRSAVEALRRERSCRVCSEMIGRGIAPPHWTRVTAEYLRAVLDGKRGEMCLRHRLAATLKVPSGEKAGCWAADMSKRYFTFISTHQPDSSRWKPILEFSRLVSPIGEEEMEVVRAAREFMTGME